ncbi:MAG: hypothetical protein Kapaf2KO_20030 [Candidatus Kapaibacteriales bacterium]
MGITAVPLIVINLLTFNYTRSNLSPYITSKSSRLILWIIGAKLSLPDKIDYPLKQTVYTFNHNSFLDILILTSLNIPNTRFMLSEKTLNYPTLILAAISIGVFYVPQKKHEKRSEKFFKKMSKRINSNSFSVAASSEGVHDFILGIESFNHEIYKMAVDSTKNMTCLFIKVEGDDTPLDFYFDKPRIKVDIFESFDMDDWTELNLAEKIDSVRNKYILKYEKEDK